MNYGYEFCQVQNCTSIWPSVCLFNLERLSGFFKSFVLNTDFRSSFFIIYIIQRSTNHISFCVTLSGFINRFKNTFFVMYAYNIFHILKNKPNSFLRVS